MAEGALGAAQALTSAPPYPFEPHVADPRMQAFNRATYYEEKARVTRTRRDASKAASQLPDDPAATRSLAQWELAVLIAERMWTVASNDLQQVFMVTAHTPAPLTAVLGVVAPQGAHTPQALTAPQALQQTQDELVQPGHGFPMRSALRGLFLDFTVDVHRVEQRQRP